MSVKTATQMRLGEFKIEDKPVKRGNKLTLKKALKLAKTKYANDSAVQEWLKIYENGIPPLTVTKDKKKEKIGGVKSHSEFAVRGLINAVRIREEKRKYGRR